MLNLTKNLELQVEILDTTNEGTGVAKIDRMVIFVAGGVKGDILKIKIIKITSSYAVGKLIEIIKPSEYRQKENDCEVSENCGGCVFRHTKYYYELECKYNTVLYAMLKAGLKNVKVDKVLSNGNIYTYRNKAEYVFANENGKTVGGFYARKTHRVINAENCLLQPPVFSKILKAVSDFADKYKISTYNEETGEGILRHLYLREGKKYSEIMATVVVNADSLPHSEELCKILTENFKEIKTIVLNINKDDTNLVLGRKNITLYGEGKIKDNLLGVDFYISPESFFQVNHDTAEILFTEVRKRVLSLGKKDITLADLYCGTGTIGLVLHDLAKRIVGIEIVEKAVADARENAKLNGIENAEFVVGDASDVESFFRNDKESIKPDAVILDPPRKGSTVAVIDYLVAKNIENIVYVSCEPNTLARDLKLFADRGYSIGEITPVDMFPRTAHVESVVMLKRG